MRVGNKDVTNPLEMIKIIMAFDSRDWFANKRDRLLYLIVFGVGDDESCQELLDHYDFTEDLLDEYRELHKRYEELLNYFDSVNPE